VGVHPAQRRLSRYHCTVCRSNRWHRRQPGPATPPVMGMTIRVGQGQSHLPADVPGISTTLGLRGRLRTKGRLYQQPADDSTAGSPSRRRRRNSSNGCFTKSSLALTRSTGSGGQAWRQPRPASTNHRTGAFSTKGSEAERRAYASEMPVKGEKALYKVVIVRQRVRGLRAHAKTAATEEPAAGQPGT
jgi:hypothetical protein